MAKGSNKTLWIVLGIVLFLLIVFVGMYNSIVTLDETADAQWANVESTYQRRADLIPNLVNTVKGYAAHEEEVLTAITEARSAWAGAGSQSEQIEAAGNMDSALARLMVVVENYPDLKASQNFMALQDELAGTENRISVERMRFNEAVRNYNIKIKRFPSNMIANMFGFEQKTLFEAQEGSENAPQVMF